MTVPRVINLSRTGGRLPKGTKLIDRRTIFGNPYVIGPHGNRETVIARYAEWAPMQPAIQDALPRLHGRDLACWCAPLPCHGDVLLRLANPLTCVKASP